MTEPCLNCSESRPKELGYDLCFECRHADPEVCPECQDDKHEDDPTCVGCLSAARLQAWMRYREAKDCGVLVRVHLDELIDADRKYHEALRREHETTAD
jgi:hypothetical protein